jgi:hypothetical protein
MPKDGAFVFDLDQNYLGFSNRPALETVPSDYARRLVRSRALAHGAPGANYFSRNSTSLGVFRFADEVAQRLNIAELVSEKLLQFARIQNGDFPTTDNN